MADLVPVYRALTVDDVQRLADYLDDRGVESYVDNTQSPLYGMSQGPSAHVLYVDSHIAEYARQVVRDFSHEWHGGVAKEDWEREETGLERPTGEKPSEDAGADTDPERERAYGPSLGSDEDDDWPGREAPEVEDLIDESGREDFEDRIARFGADRDVAEEDRFAFFEEGEIDAADTRQGLDEEETQRSEARNRGGDEGDEE